MNRFLYCGIALVLIASAYSLLRPWGRVRGAEQLATQPASGVVTFHGKAVPNATVSLQREDGRVAALGVTDPAGSFKLSTYREHDGAPVGKYRVTVAATRVEYLNADTLAPEPPTGFPSAVPPHLSNPDTSRLQVEVTLDGPNHFGFHIR